MKFGGRKLLSWIGLEPKKPGDEDDGHQHRSGSSGTAPADSSGYRGKHEDERLHLCDDVGWQAISYEEQLRAYHQPGQADVREVLGLYAVGFDGLSWQLKREEECRSSGLNLVVEARLEM